MKRIGSNSALVWRVAMLCITAAALVQAADVRGRVSVTAREARAVVWMIPLSGRTDPPLSGQNTSSRPKLNQKNKRFSPHVIAVQIGSVVDFPNRDPFFHNVFSLFDGKRFDLGLYEAGSTRSVRFDRAGVSYIFCNIHPEMSAVVVVVDTPYFAVANSSGEFQIPQVPAGRYQWNVWEERCLPKTLKDVSRQVTVGEDGAVLGTVHLQDCRELVTVHLNKYGKSYDPQVFSSPSYVQR